MNIYSTKKGLPGHKNLDNYLCSWEYDIECATSRVEPEISALERHAHLAIASEWDIYYVDSHPKFHVFHSLQVCFKHQPISHGS